MAILGKKGSQIEVRLQKVLAVVANNAHAPASYFDEYAQIGRKDTSTDAVARYILPGDCTYMIAITLKTGFVYGDGGLAVRLWDKKNNKFFHERTLINSLGRSSKTALVGEKSYHIKFVPHSQEGEENVPVAFYVLCPDQPPPAALVSGRELKVIESLTVEVVRYSRPRSELKIDAGHDEVEFQQNFKIYDVLRKTLRSDVQAQGQVGNAIGRERQVNYGGVTPATRLIGSAEASHLLKPPERYYTSEVIERLRFEFIRCTKDFIAEHNLAKTPIPEEFQPWESLNDAQRRACFKLLQEADKKKTEEQKYAEAGAITQQEKNAIHKTLFKVGIPPNRWRPYDSLRARERPALFEELQARRKFFDRGEFPPELSMLAASPHTPSKVSASSAAPTSAASAFLSTTRPPTSAASSRLSPLKRESSDSPSRAAPLAASRRVSSGGRCSVKSTRTCISKLSISDDDDDSEEDIPLSVRRGSAHKLLAKPPNKSDADTTSTVSRTAKRPAAAADTSPSKRAKIDPGDSSTITDEGSELRMMMEKAEREEAEYIQEQRVLERLRALNETKARIAEMKAKKTA